MPDPSGIFRMVLLHPGDAADPELIHWLKDRMDSIIGLGPWAMVGVTAAIVIAIPTAICVLYYCQQRRHGSPLP